MRAAVIIGTQQKRTTEQILEMFIQYLPEGTQIVRVVLPRDLPRFCSGCLRCVTEGKENCKDYAYVQKIDNIIRDSEVLLFFTPTYVYHVTAAMKNMLDHLAYLFLLHQPIKGMQHKRAVIVSQCIGGGARGAVKDIKDSLKWWGVGKTEEICIYLTRRNRFREKAKIEKCVKRIQKPAGFSLSAEIKRRLAKKIVKKRGQKNKEDIDYLYWMDNGML